ncbi:MAG TPA: hypothetical protein VJR92_06205 [Gemmatimonadaceae bacterium]|nr:hypothetical protein [Gemmatimonadaceae bacterium]
MHVGAIADFGGDVSAIGVEGGYGKARSYFVKGHAVRAQVNGGAVTSTTDPAGMTFNATGGMQFAFGKRSHGQFCPLVTGSMGNVELTNGNTLERSEIGVGGSFGFVHTSNAGFHLVPYVGLSVAQLDRRIDPPGAADVNLGTETYYPLTGGVGMHFENSFAVIANLTFPLELPSADPVFGLRMTVPVGGRRR